MNAKTLLAAAALACALPVTAFARHNVEVDVRILAPHGHSGHECGRTCGSDYGYGDENVWIEFSPKRDAFVALYAAYSDGSVSLVFPARDWNSHWVDSCDWYELPVNVPCGVRLESVQAVAARRWFDPAECWVAAAPRRCGTGGYGGVTVYTSARRSLVSWNFSIAWGGPRGYYRVESRRCATPTYYSSWAQWRRDFGHSKHYGYGDRHHYGSQVKYKAGSPRVRRGDGKGHRKARVNQVAAADRRDGAERHSRWTKGSDSRGSKTRKAAPNTNVSKSRGKTGEPKRRLKR